MCHRWGRDLDATDEGISLTSVDLNLTVSAAQKRTATMMQRSIVTRTETSRSEVTGGTVELGETKGVGSRPA